MVNVRSQLKKSYSVQLGERHVVILERLREQRMESEGSNPSAKGMLEALLEQALENEEKRRLPSLQEVT